MATPPAELADVGLFGGAFDPPHRTHEKIVRAALAQLPIRRLIVLPAGLHPHKQGRVCAAPSARLELCRIAFAGIEGVEVDDYELRLAGPSYTVDTVRHFRECVTNGRRPWWLLGSDNLPLLPSWYRPHDLLQLAALAIYPRAGTAADATALAGLALTSEQQRQLVVRVLQVEPDAVSSREVRGRLSRGQDVGSWLHPGVAEQIRKLGLYAAEA